MKTYIENLHFFKVSTLNTNQSRDVRDAFAKGIYGRLFVHIVRKINVAIHRQENNKTSSNEEKCSIGVLDIFGFENFDANSFEQVTLIPFLYVIQKFFYSLGVLYSTLPVALIV